MRLGRWIGLASVVVVVVATASTGMAAPPPAQFLIQSYSMTSGRIRLEVVDSSGHVVRVLSKNVGSNSVLSPSRELVAYESVKGLVVESVDGTGRRLLVCSQWPCARHSVCAPASFVWSPDSTELLVATLQLRNHRVRNSHLSVVSISTGRSHRIVGPRYAARYRAVAWSGRANEIAYIADRNNQPSLVVAAPNGRSRQTLCWSTCGDPQNDPYVAWSPDGKWIVYTTLDDGATIVDVGAGTTSDVANVAGTPLWSPDSSRFAMETSSGTTFFSPTGSVVDQNGVTDARFLGWQVDGIYFITDPNPNELFRIPNGQATAQTVFSLPTDQAVISAEPLQ